MATEIISTHPPKPPDPYVDVHVQGFTSAAARNPNLNMATDRISDALLNVNKATDPHRYHQDISGNRKSLDAAAGQNPKQPPPSYASMVMGSAKTRPAPKPRFSPIPLPARQVGAKEGRPAISFTGAEVNACEKRFEFSLVAKFTVGRPSIMEIQTAFQQAWKLSGRASISPIWDARHILIILDSEADARVALSSSLNKVGHAFFRLFRWRPDYNPKKESKYATIWVKLPDIPLSIYDTSFIGAIVSTFGYFVDTDERTKACAAVQYARACVELDVTAHIPDSVWISLPNEKGYWQSIVIDSKISYCNRCKVHGHSLSNCRKSKTQKSRNQKLGPHGPSAEVIKERPRAAEETRDKNVTGNLTEIKKNVASSSNAKVGEEEQWQEVTRKKTNRVAARGVSVLKNPSFVNTSEDNAAKTNSVVLEDLNITLDGRDNLALVPYTELAETSAGNEVADENATDDHGQTKVPILSNEGHTSEVFYDDRFQSHVHQNGIDHYLKILDKKGSACDQIEGTRLSYVTQRSKKKGNTGSKHCLSKKSQ